MPKIHDVSKREEDSCERMGSQEDENGPSHGHQKVCHHEDRYSIEVLVQSLFQDRTASCFRTVNGVDKYVTESMLTKEEGDIASEKPIAETRLRQKPTATLTSVFILVVERKWIDIEKQRSHDQKCFEVSKAITRLLRHDQTVPRGIDGAIQYNDIIEERRKKKFDGPSQWSREDWISTLAKGEGSLEKVSILFESKVFQSVAVPSGNSRIFRRYCY